MLPPYVQNRARFADTAAELVLETFFFSFFDPLINLQALNFQNKRLEPFVVFCQVFDLIIHR